MTRYLVTGVAGFIGSHVARRLVDMGETVVGIDDLSAGRLENVPSGVQFVRGDLADPKTLDAIPCDCEKILHLAGQSSGEISFDNPVDDLSKNTISTLQLIRYAMERGVERFVYASSMSVYGHVPDRPIAEDHVCAPLSCYGVGKLAAENYLRVYANKLQSVSMRMFNVYGPGQDMSNLRQGMVSIFLAQALDPGAIIVKGSVERFRDLVFIDDVVEAWMRAAVSEAAIGNALNVGTGRRTSVRELLRLICELVPGASFRVQGSTPGDQSGIYADATKLATCLGKWDPVPLERGLPIFVQWARRRMNVS